MPLYAFPPPKSALEIWLPIIGGCLIVLVVGLMVVALCMYWQSRRFEGKDAAEGAGSYQMDITQFERQFSGKHPLVVEALIYEAEKSRTESEVKHRHNVEAFAGISATLQFMHAGDADYKHKIAQKSTIENEVKKSKEIHTNRHAAWEAMMMAADKMKRDGKMSLNNDFDTFLGAAKAESKASMLLAKETFGEQWPMVKAYLLAKDKGM